MRGYPFHRVDIGEYRIVYAWDDKTVDVFLIGKRNDDEVYKRLKRKIR
jgi:mRNA interferase RelE/StbE